MQKRKVGVIDLVTKAPTRSMWARIMFPNFASIMPQVVSSWCEQDGHDVNLVVYTGFEDLADELPTGTDVIFITAFSHAAQLAYALSALLRSKGAVTVLGGPHARAYPEDAVKYFDYVLGFTDQEIIRSVLSDCSQHRPIGQHLAAAQQPQSLPGVRERWKFIKQTLDKAPLVKAVPMLGSLGCPYTCSFCVDSAVPYQPLEFDVLRDDLRFLRTKFKRPVISWHDPNFGVRFDDYLGLIEEAGPPGSMAFVAESSLSLLPEERLKRLRRAGFKAMLPGVESWFDLGDKSKTGSQVGMNKVRQVADHMNLIMRYIPYVQTNFVLGLDADEGPEPFECTKAFVDSAPAAYPAYCQLSAFGQAAPLNLEHQRAGRILPFPFHFLNTQSAMNVRPKNYNWVQFYRHMIDLTRHTFSPRALANRVRASGTLTVAGLNFLRGATAQGRGRAAYYSELCDRLETDRQFRAFFEQETNEVPRFFLDRMKNELGDLYEWLPRGAIHHDPNAYLASHQAGPPPIAVTPQPALA
ncbi:MAG: radical SAM protein [Acidobacteria bacterium]|nr:radical SAM protein [Acidobacteriota bacterium]